MLADAAACGPLSLCRPGRRAARGFTMIELLIVVSLIAVISSVAALALRDPSATMLEREAARLGALLESARAEARAAGVLVRWAPMTAREDSPAGFVFVGLPASLALPTGWLSPGVSAEVLTPQGPAPGAVLGPEPVIGEQRIVLRLDTQSLMLATDGLGPFVVTPQREGDRAPR